MSAVLLFALAILALALGLALFGFNALLQQRREEQHVRVIERALLQQPASMPPADAPARSLWRRVIDLLESIGRRFEHSRLGRSLLAPEDLLLLEQINRNTAAGRAIFLGLRLVLALLLPAVVLLWLHPGGARGVVELLCALGLGLLLPKLALSAWAERLRKRVEDELPLLVDLLRLLQGVGFSVDQSLQTIAERFQPVLPVLGREIRDANLAYMRGRPRPQSLRRLATSFGNDDLQSLVQILLQVHEHGGAVQEPLRQFAERLREQRKMSMKEKTGKLAVKMTVVMMLTLLPALMLVLAGPAVVSLVGSLAKFRGH